MPRDVPESASNVPSELNDSTRVLTSTRNSDSYITEGTTSHTTDGDNSSFTDDLSDSGPLNYISSLTIIDEENKMVEEYPKHDMPGACLVSLSHNLIDGISEYVYYGYVSIRT